MSQLALDTDMHWGIVHVCPASHERWRETLPHRRYRMAHIFALWTAFWKRRLPLGAGQSVTAQKSVTWPHKSSKLSPGKPERP